MFTGKKIILGVTGSIAAYKIASLASMLKKQGGDITVIMTENAANFITPITFETLTGNKCLIDTFDRHFEFNVEHVALAKQADVFLLAPASANVIGKIANGIADDMLTTTYLACECPKILAPAMNTRMYRNPIVQDNLDKCRHYGMEIVTPAAGYLACGDTGDGKMPEPEVLRDAIAHAIACAKDMQGLRVLVTAGPTREAIDPVRFISNHSTGKMGYAIAKHCMLRGADVTLVTGPTKLPVPPYLTCIPVTTAREMFEAVTSVSASQDIIIKAAAVADYRPTETAQEKVKKSDDALSLSRRHPALSGTAQTGRTVPVRLFHGNGTSARKCPDKTGAQKSGFDRGKQSERNRRRLRRQHQRGDADCPRQPDAASPYEQGRSCKATDRYNTDNEKIKRMVKALLK